MAQYLVQSSPCRLGIVPTRRGPGECGVPVTALEGLRVRSSARGNCSAPAAALRSVCAWLQYTAPLPLSDRSRRRLQRQLHQTLRALHRAWRTEVPAKPGLFEPHSVCQNEMQSDKPVRLPHATAPTKEWPRGSIRWKPKEPDDEGHRKAFKIVICIHH